MQGGQLGQMANAMNAGTVKREVISNPITLESTVNGALVTVQRNSIAHAELAQGENGMLVRGYNTNNRGKVFSAGVGFNKDGTIKGREHLIPQRTPSTDVRNISPAQSAVRQRPEAPNAPVVEDNAEHELALAEANDKVSAAQLAEAETKQRLDAVQKQLEELQAKQKPEDSTTTVTKRR